LGTSVGFAEAVVGCAAGACVAAGVAGAQADSTMLATTNRLNTNHIVLLRFMVILLLKYV
jgi:hypothetical protein